MKLQIAFDLLDVSKTLRILASINNEIQKKNLEPSKLIIEAGTPLIKYHGIKVLTLLKLASPNIPLLADLKTMDVAALEFRLAFSYGADIASVLAQATLETIKSGVLTAVEKGKKVSIDFIGVPYSMLADRFQRIIRELKEYRDRIIFSFHRAIDVEKTREEFSIKDLLQVIRLIKNNYPNVIVAIAGGITPDNLQEIRESGVDIVVVGRYITQSKAPLKRIKEFFP